MPVWLAAGAPGSHFDLTWIDAKTDRSRRVRGGRSMATRGSVAKYLRYLLACMCPGWLFACAPAPTPPVYYGEDVVTVYVVRHGWHTGIVVAHDDLPPGRLPEADDFPQARFYEFGWGDREYYPALDPTPIMALAAAFASTAAAMRLRALDQPPAGGDPEVDVVGISLTRPEIDHLTAKIAADFDRPEGGRAAVIARHASSASNFYPAHGQFHLFNNCNTWVATKLAATGLPVSPSGVVTAGDLMARLQNLPMSRRVGGHRRDGAAYSLAVALRTPYATTAR